jgi:RHS repeat-associated protein
MKLKSYITTLLTGAASLISQCASAQTNNPGFVQTDVIKQSGITTDAQANALGVTGKQTTRSYYDGLGRTIQTVGVQASPLQNDLIQPVAYDNLGRQTKSYLPYAGKSTDAMGSYRNTAISTDQPAFYNQTGQYVIPVDTGAYATQVFENSPLQRLLNSGLAGAGYHYGVTGAHYKTVSYRSNIAATDGNILIWNPDGTFTSANYYADNKLSVTDGKDEDNVETLTFTDLAGHTLLKRQMLSSGNLDTYYIYNMAGMISYIVPPKAVGLLASNSYSLTATSISNLVFHFTYDNRGRMISKTVPAKGTMYMVYDPMNRLVLAQDANMAAANKWNYIKYDAKGRAISQGIYVDNTYTSQSAMQAHVSNDISFATWCEKRQGTVNNNGYYTNNVFPTSNTTPLAYAYYDDYDLNQDGTDDFAYVTQSDANLPNEESATIAKLKGMPTIVSKTTVGSGLGGTWLTTATFYDKRLNPIQVRSNNHVYYTGATAFTDTKTVVPDFMGAPQASKIVKQTASGTSVTVYTYLAYDDAYRITGVSQRYNSGSTQTIASYTYNELGQVIKKGLGYVNSTTWLQNVDMRYNIRGQLLSINNSKLTSDGGVTNGDTNDVFGMQLLYDQTDGNLANGAGNAARYDGRLSAVKWMSADASGNKTYERSYTYAYDNVNRYTGSTYSERTTTGSGSFSNNVNGFDESGITYDAGGNITALNRNSSTQGTNSHTQIDALTYTYSTTNPYQLASVADGSGSGYGFMAGSGTYSYDANGNLTNEPYKGLSQIYYDVLNRTDKIVFTSSSNRYIDYTYDAGGNLIRKQQYDNVGGVATLQNTTDYIDGFVYINNTLSYFSMPEGRVINNSGTLVQEFIITDQQGNARVSFQNNGSGAAIVKQENSYYGFGMQLLNSPVALPTVPNKQLYNGGSEWQNDYSNLPYYYQTFNRNYDAALGRFIGVDPKAESAESMTSYQYAGNNPIMFNDPLGDAATGRYQGNINPPTDSSSPSIHLDNGVVDQLQQDMLDFFGAFDAAGDAAGQVASQGGWVPGGQDAFGSIFTGMMDAIKNANYNARINNTASQQTNSTQSGYYSVFYQTSSLSNYNGQEQYDLDQVNITGHTIWIPFGGANQGGGPGLLGGKSNPASWVFTPAGPDGNYQTAGVSGILFHELSLIPTPEGWLPYGVEAAIVRMKTLYFEFPRITSMYGFEETLIPQYAAFVMANATDAAIRATDKAWDASNGNLDMFQLGNIFFQNLSRIVQSAGGRVTLQPNYKTVVTPYSTL